MKQLLIMALWSFLSMGWTWAESFVLFDKVFTFEKEDAIPTKSHLKVPLEELSKQMPKDWTSPINYADGKVHIEFEVLEKPEGDEATYWSLCYIANKGQNGSGYACTSSPRYTKEGKYEIAQDMKKLWQKDKVVWSEGIKMMTLVIKAGRIKGGQGHAHLLEDMDKFFPTKIRVKMTQLSE